MKQTAVEWLLEYCERENWSIPFDVEHTAKEMEKEQIMDAYMEGGDWESLPQPRFDNYYNQTFNTKER